MLYAKKILNSSSKLIYTVILCFAFLIANSSTAQNFSDQESSQVYPKLYIDSLAKHASEKEILRITYNSLELLHAIMKRRYEMAIEANDESKIGYGLFKLGETELYLGKSEVAQEHLLSALSYFRKTKNYQFITASLKCLGKLKSQQLDVLEALNYLQEGYKSARKIEKDSIRTQSMAYISAEFGEAYRTVRMYDKALIHYKECTKLFEKNGYTSGIVQCYVMIAEIYTEMGQYSKALEYEFKARKYVGPNELAIVSMIDLAMGQTYETLGEIQNAQKYYAKCFEVSKKTNYQLAKTGSLIGLARINLETGGKLDSVLSYAEQALVLATELQNNIHRLEALRILARVHKELGNFQLSLEMNERRDELENQLEIENQATDLKLAEVRKKLEFREKSLQSENNELIKANNKLESQAYIFVIAGITLLLLMLVLYYRYHRKLKTERLILLDRLQKLDLESINKTSQVVGLELNAKRRLNRKQINSFSEHKLNETDWKIIDEIHKEPEITNREIASRIYLSYDGVVSALRKMYKLFDINVKRHHRIELLMKLRQISNSESTD